MARRRRPVPLADAAAPPRLAPGGASCRAAHLPWASRPPLRRLRAAVLTVSGAGLALCVFAAAAQPQATTDYLALMDTDGDGRVSLAEYQAWMTYAFDRMDANGDGRLDPSEQPGGRGTVLTREAYLARMAERFNRQDANRDGYLDARELAAPPR